MNDPTIGGLLTGLLAATIAGILGIVAKGRSDPATGMMALAATVERLQVELTRRDMEKAAADKENSEALAKLQEQLKDRDEQLDWYRKRVDELEHTN